MENLGSLLNGMPFGQKVAMRKALILAVAKWELWQFLQFIKINKNKTCEAVFKLLIYKRRLFRLRRKERGFQKNLDEQARDF